MNNNLLLKIKQSPVYLALSVAVLLSTGCSDRVGMAQQEMDQIRNQPSQPIELPPKVELIEDFVYSSNRLRSPFLPPSKIL